MSICNGSTTATTSKPDIVKYIIYLGLYDEFKSFCNKMKDKTTKKPIKSRQRLGSMFLVHKHIFIPPRFVYNDLKKVIVASPYGF